MRCVYLLRQTIALLVLMATTMVAHAGHEGTAVTEGPMTALEKLSSLKDLPAPESRRAVSIQHWVTTNGARVYFVEARELPMVDLRFVFDAGGARDGVMAGLASITNRMLSEGTPTRDTSRIAADFEHVGARFSASSHRDMAVLQLRVLSDPAYSVPALDVFADVVAHPQFPEEALARIMQGSEVGLQQQEQSPAALARKQFYKALYGTHPYAEPPAGTRTSLSMIGRNDLLGFHQRYYVARNLTIAIVGSLSRQEAEMMAERATAALPAGEPAPALPKVAALKKARHLHQEFPSAQTHILVGQPGVPYGDPDYFALMVGNEILGGGGFTSRLMKEVRQQRGLAYGVSSGFTQMRAAGPFTINLSTRSDQATEALVLLRRILADYVRQGPSDSELGEAKANIIGSFPLSTASNASISGYLGAIGFYGLPLDYLDQYLDRVQAVTAKDIRRAFQRHIDPARLLVVTVGKSAS